MGVKIGKIKQNMLKNASTKPVVFVFTTAYEPFIGGAEIAVSEIVRRLQDEFRFFIFTSKFRLNLPRYEERGGIVIRRIGFGFRFDKFLLPLLGFFAAKNEAKKNKPELFWAVMASYSSGIPYLLNIFRRGKNVPVVLTLQEGDSLEHIRGAKFGLVDFSWKLALRRTHYLTAISSFLLDLAKQYGYGGEGIVIPNGVDVSAFSRKISERQRTAFRRKLGIADDEQVVITTSRLVRKNAVDTIIRAAAILHRGGMPVRLVVVGSGTDRLLLEKLAHYEGVGDRVLFAGAVPHHQVPMYLCGADVFVRPSRSEGLGNSFIEAMAAGVPVIGTAVGGITDFLEHEKTGLVSAVDDPSDLARSIDRLLADSALRNLVIFNAKEFVIRRYQWERITKDFSKVFFSVIGNKSKPNVLVATPLFPPDIGGPATYSKFLADHLPSRGFTVTVLSFGVVRHFPKVVRHFAYFLKMFSAGRSADFIFAQDPVSVGLPSVLAAKLLGKKIIMKIVGDYAWEQGFQRFGVSDLPDEFQNRRYGVVVEFLRFVERFTAAHSDRIVVPSEYLKRIVTGWGVPGKNIYVIANAVSGFGDIPPREDVRRTLGVSGTILVSVGRLVPWKGFLALVECMKYVAEQHTDAKLFIIGDGPELESIKIKIREDGLSDRVMLLGNLSRQKVGEYIRAADLFLLNSGYEGLSHQIIEAMAIGTPVLVSDIAANRDVVTSGHNGLLLSYNDKEGWQKAIVAALADGGLRLKLGREGMKRAMDFSGEVMLKKTAEFFRGQL